MNVSAEIPPSNDRWLKRYYAARAVFSALWVALAFTVGKAHPSFGIALIVAYPAWDCLANYVDAERSGGLRGNLTQTLNVIVSAIVTLAVVVAASRDFHDVIAVVGIWATLSGLLQLATGVRRWRRAGAQWPMVLSGTQSALAGAFFVKMAADDKATSSVADVAPYAAFGALYFAISAVVLVSRRR